MSEDEEEKLEPVARVSRKAKHATGHKWVSSFHQLCLFEISSTFCVQ